MRKRQSKTEYHPAIKAAAKIANDNDRAFCEAVNATGFFDDPVQPLSLEFSEWLVEAASIIETVKRMSKT